MQPTDNIFKKQITLQKKLAERKKEICICSWPFKKRHLSNQLSLFDKY